MAVVKLSKDNEAALEALKAKGMDEALIAAFHDALLAAKQETASTRTRSGRSLSLHFTPASYQLFKLRVVDGKTQPEVLAEVEGADVPKVMASLHQVGYKLIGGGVKMGLITEEMLDKIVAEYAKEKADEKVDPETGDTVEDTEPAATPDASESEIEALLAGTN